ncbi:MAG: SagB family peptide dehydrogenase [Alphaproteobacteria bacterium]|nr:SagB family peptide dehydrogenase [Alphaproteobacteria bacterium]
MLLNKDVTIGLGVGEIARKQLFPLRQKVNWDDEPYRFKYYIGHPFIRLDPMIPLNCGDEIGTLAAENTDPIKPTALRLFHLLFCLCAPLQTRRALAPATAQSAAAGETPATAFGPSALTTFRGLPSGGGLFPWEVYIAADGQADLAKANGVFHYDPAHHRLDVLTGDQRGALAETTACVPGDIHLCFSAVYWKNYFKYGHAAVQLHPLDIGIAVAQLSWLAPAFGFAASCALQFADHPLAAAFGLDPEKEAMYAVVGLTDLMPSPLGRALTVVARAGTPSVLERSVRGFATPLARLINDASQIDGPYLPATVSPSTPQRTGDTVLPMDKPSAVTDYLLFRRSGVDSLSRANLSADKFSRLHQQASKGLDCDLGAALRPHLRTVWAVQGVEGLEPGLYHDETDKPIPTLLEQRERAQIASWLQASYSLTNLNVDACAAVLLLFTKLGDVLATFGNRGFRLINIEAGACVQRLYAASHLLGLGCHALYGLQEEPVRAGTAGIAAEDSFILGVALGNPVHPSGKRTMPLWV